MTELAIEVKNLEFAWPSKAAFLRVPTLSLQQGQTLFVGGVVADLRFHGM
jgi:hypothetical protein